MSSRLAIAGLIKVGGEFGRSLRRRGAASQRILLDLLTGQKPKLFDNFTNPPLCYLSLVASARKIVASIPLQNQIDRASRLVIERELLVRIVRVRNKALCSSSIDPEADWVDGTGVGANNAELTV